MFVFISLQVLFIRICNFGMFYVRHVSTLFSKLNLPKFWKFYKHLVFTLCYIFNFKIVLFVRYLHYSG
jgi:hypothetical protein